MRCFLGLEVPEDLAGSLEAQIAPLRDSQPPARWLPPTRWHLTLVFLGRVEGSRLAELRRAIAPVFADAPSFETRLIGAGCFPEGRPGRVAWVGVERSARLERLREALAEVCLALGFEPDPKPWSPHLTVARCKRPWRKEATEAWIRAGLSLRLPALPVARGCLFESVPRPRGVHYTVVQSYPLGGTAERA